MTSTETRRLVDKLWNYCNVLRDDGVSSIDYVEQLTFLLFLKMAHERESRSLNPERILPSDPAWQGRGWQELIDNDGQKLEVIYRQLLEDLGQQHGTLGVIFRKAQNRVQDPAKLKRLVKDLIGQQNWSGTGTDVKGDAYEELLGKSAEDIKSGAGQYFTPRALIRAMVDCVRPTPDDTVIDPACGTGGFLMVAAEHIYAEYGSSLSQGAARHRISHGAICGTELVDGTARLAAMNLLLHGIGTYDGEPLVEVGDALARHPAKRATVVLANPPFGRKSSITVFGADGRAGREDIAYERQDFWVTTTNKQLNFVQHIAKMLQIDGRAAVVVPDNVLFEGGAGETVRRRLLAEFDVHTLLRLPTGIFYAGGVKANVLFFDQPPSRGQPPLDREALGLRPARRPALHPQAEPAAARAPPRLRRLLPARQASGRARRVRTVHGVRLRRAGRPRQGEPRHHLAEGPRARRRRHAAAARGHRRRDRRGPPGRPRRVHRRRRGPPSGGGPSIAVTNQS